MDRARHDEILDGKRDEQFVMETPRAGGYGPSSEPPPEGPAIDRENGQFSAQYMRRHYGP
jgi:N-methylhydantoinase B/oxoprolinase/acetone carboxylase alpha subunit